MDLFLEIGSQVALVVVFAAGLAWYTRRAVRRTRAETDRVITRHYPDAARSPAELEQRERDAEAAHARRLAAIDSEHAKRLAELDALLRAEGIDPATLDAGDGVPAPAA